MTWVVLVFEYLSVLTSTKLSQLYTNLVMLAQGLPGYAADTGAADAYAGTPTPAPTALVAGMRAKLKATNANTGASTLDWGGLGPIAIKKRGGAAALVEGDIVANQLCVFEHDGTYWQLVSDRKIAKADISTTGTFAEADIPTLAKSKISSTGAWAETEIPTLAKSKISGTGTWAATDLPQLFSTITDQTGSRVVGTYYQNTSGRTMIVFISAHSDSAASWSLYVDTDYLTPTQIVGYADSTANATVFMVGVVPNGSYIKIVRSAGTPTMAKWVEMTF